MEAKTNWNPGKEPAHPIDYGVSKREGITKRDYFVAAILSGVMASQKVLNEPHEKVVAAAVAVADEALAFLYPDPKKNRPAPEPMQDNASCKHQPEFMFYDSTKKWCCRRCSATGIEVKVG